MSIYKAMSFNIRYLNKIDGINCWKNRCRLVIDIINKQNPIVFGLQEGVNKQVRDVAKQLKKYKWVGVGRENGKKKGEYCAIFYDTNRLKLEQTETLWLSMTPNTPGTKSWDSSQCRIVTKAVLTIKDTGKTLIYYNVHLDHRGPISRIKSIQRLKQMVMPHESDAVIIAGDFNFEPDSNEYVEMLNGSILEDSKYAKDVITEGPERTSHGFNNEYDMRIDYFYINKNIRAKKYTSYKLETINGVYASDHYPIILEFSIA